LAMFHAESYTSVTVQIQDTEMVSALAKLIKEETRPMFDNISPSNLTLWNVSESKLLDDDDDLAENVAKFKDLDQMKSMRSTHELSKVFQDVSDDDEHIHIIVRPSPGECESAFFIRFSLSHIAHRYHAAADPRD
jgi:hypothetical protein